MATLAERYTFPHEDTDTCSQCLKTFPFELFLIERNGRVSKMAYCTLCFQRIQTTGQKRCKDCGRTQPLKNFAASPSSSDEHRHSCYGCAGKSSAPSTKSEGAKVVVDRATKNSIYRKYGYYWSKPKRNDGWVLLDRRGYPVNHPDRLWMNIQINPEKYEEDGKKARIAAIQVCQKLVQEGCIILDVETTGAGGEYEEMVEITLMDAASGTVLFSSLVSCKEQIAQEATEKSGITNEMVADAPTFPEMWKHVSPLLANKRVAAFNANFDVRILGEEAQLFKLAIPQYFPHCLMRLYMAIVTEGRYNLDTACTHFGIESPSHRSTQDCESTRQLLIKMSQVED